MNRLDSSKLPEMFASGYASMDATFNILRDVMPLFTETDKLADQSV